MAIPIILGETISGSVTGGETILYSISLPGRAKYVIETTGPASVNVSLWGPGDADGPVPGTGKLKLCGVGAWGCATVPGGVYAVRVIGESAGAFSVKVRNWSFFDYFQMYFHKSSC